MYILLKLCVLVICVQEGNNCSDVKKNIFWGYGEISTFITFCNLSQFRSVLPEAKHRAYFISGWQVGDQRGHVKERSVYIPSVEAIMAWSRLLLLLTVVKSWCPSSLQHARLAEALRQKPAHPSRLGRKKIINISKWALRPESLNLCLTSPKQMDATWVFYATGSCQGPLEIKLVRMVLWERQKGKCGSKKLYACEWECASIWPVPFLVL